MEVVSRLPSEGTCSLASNLMAVTTSPSGQVAARR